MDKNPHKILGIFSKIRLRRKQKNRGEFAHSTYIGVCQAKKDYDSVTKGGLLPYILFHKVINRFIHNVSKIIVEENGVKWRLFHSSHVLIDLIKSGVVNT